MPSLFNKFSSVANSGRDEKARRSRHKSPKRSCGEATTTTTAAPVAFDGDEDLLQLHEETAELLRLVKTTAKNVIKCPNTLSMRQKAGNSPAIAAISSPSVSRMRTTIEVLEQDDEENDETLKTTSSDPLWTNSANVASSAGNAQSSVAVKDLFAFDAEESRVRRAADTFYPDTSPGKKSMEKQVNTFEQEQHRLRAIERNNQRQIERKQQEQQQMQTNRFQDRIEASAIKIQARSRGFLCRKKVKKTHPWPPSNATAKASALDEDQWHEVRDIEKGEVWYYNARTGQSQWERPPSFPVTDSMTSGGGSCLLPELRTVNESANKIPRTSLGRSSSSQNGFDLPLLSPTTSSACSSARSQSTAQENRPNSYGLTNKKSSHTNTGLNVRNLPALQFDYAGLNPNPWECDSVVDSEESFRTDRLNENDVDFSRGRRSILEIRDERDGEDEQQQDDENGDWQANDTLFLADGTRNSKLRDTIRNALQVSKFDSISSLIASNVVLRKKPTTKNHFGFENSPGSPARSNQKTSSKSIGREIVLGKRETPFLVSVLANDADKRGGSSSPTMKTHGSRRPATSTIKAKSKQKGANGLANPPSIRDVVDPGFHEDLNASTATVRVQSASGESSNVSSTSSVTVCFNCWSSSKGKYCDIHRDPNETRKIRSTESALMCANWDLDQLRRKYRAEEIQEVFMKQNASLRYDSKLKQYVTITECRHPIYRSMNQLLMAWNKTMRRKIHTRAWFRSFMEQLRAGGVPKTDSSTPGLLKLKNTIQNNKWCSKYADSVREFHPKAPVTQKNQSGQTTLIHDVIMIDPARPQLRNWVLKTDCTKPVELYKPRSYELPPKRCVPMPTPSFLEEIPLPVPNLYIDAGHIVSWFERLCARVSTAALHKAVLQIHACSPPPGITDARRTKHVTPLTVMFATFGRKPTKDNIAVGGLSAELLIHMLVTTYVPAQFGNFVVFDRRSIAPSPTKDHDAVYACAVIDAETLGYVFRPLEHALNFRRPPCIVISTRSYPTETDILALETHRFPLNRPEQTGEEQAHGFRTFVLVDAFSVPDEVLSVPVQPNSEILSPNSTSMNPTITTKVDRYYPFCIPTTKENTPIEYIHLLWIGQSSRNQPQVFTTLGAQQPGEFMKNSNPDGALGGCTSVIYRSWAYMQSSPFEEFVTEDGIAYWYDKHTGETYWTRPIMPAEKHRGKDGDVDGVVTDGEGEPVTLGVGVDEARYSQQSIRKYMTKGVETQDERERRVKRVAASAKTHDITIQLPVVGENRTQSTNGKSELTKVQVPKLAFHREERESISINTTSKNVNTHASHTSSIRQQQIPGSMRAEALAADVENPPVDLNTKQLIATITQALGSAIPGLAQNAGIGTNSVDMLQLGIGLGMGLGLRSQQQQQPSPTKQTQRTTIQSERSRLCTYEEFRQNDGIDDENEIITSRSDESSVTLSARSTVSTASFVSLLPPPDEAEMVDNPNSYSSSPLSKPSGYVEKKPGYQTHAPPGEGRTWIHKPIDTSADSQTAVEGFGGKLHQRVACLPKNFVAAVTSTKTCKIQANYLPVIKNMNQPRSVGIVRPRAALDEWLAVGYSPWSAGRSVFGTQFIENLMLRPELMQESATNATTTTSISSPNAQAVEKRETVTQAMKESQQLETILSLCRHGKYDEIELMLNSPDWTLNIDAKDATGNTVLSVACQNNNKRIAKLCLRRGADINTQNLNGQTVLHYCHEYGFHDLMEYLMEKGARDDILNADGLTCYEGLSKESVDSI